MILIVQTILADQLFHALAHVVNHRGILLGENMEIPLMGRKRPQGCHQNLPRQGRNPRKQIGKVFGQKPNDNVHDEVADAGRKELAIHQFRNALHGHLERIVHTPKRDVQNEKQRHNQIVTEFVERGGHPLCVIQVPAQCKRHRHQCCIHQFDDLQHQIMS